MNITNIETRHYSKNLNKQLAIWAVLIAGILLTIFLVGAPWTSTDYFFGGSVLFLLAAGYEFATVKLHSLKQRIAVAILVGLILVGILGWAATGP